jgi:methyl-accepting chemotaxis protein
MLTNLRISTRLIIAFAIMLLFIAIIGIAGYIGLWKMDAQLNAIALVDAKKVEFAQRSRANINGYRRFEKDLFLKIATGNAAKMAEIKKEFDDNGKIFHERMDALAKLVAIPKDKETLSTIRTLMTEYEAGFNKVYEQIKSGAITTPLDADKTLGQTKYISDKAQKILVEFAEQKDKQMEAAVKEAIASSVTIQNTIVILAGIAVLLAFLLAIIITRSITSPLAVFLERTTDIAQGEGDLTKRIDTSGNDEIAQISGMFNQFIGKLHTIISRISTTSIQIAVASSQLNATSGQIATGAEQVAAQSTTVATAGEEISATSGNIAQSCQMAAEAAQQASQSATNGAGIVDSAITIINNIAVRVSESAQMVAGLGDRSDQIGAIIGTIEDIADQTNLLALNAAIEAARAGEQGRGFAVVADEVRALAERTTRATKEIAALITTIQRETKGAVVAMEQGVNQVKTGTSEAAKSGEALRDILEQVNAVTMQVNQIATAAEEQTCTTGEISNNMQQITQVVQDTANGAHQSAQAAARLNNTAEELQRLVRQFKL